MPVKILKEFLDNQKVKYVCISHSIAYTAQEIAATAHLPGKELAKTVILIIDDRMAMVVLPANRKVILHDLRETLGASEVRFATEQEFKDRFPGCETGAMPPFGNLYGMDVYVAPSLAEDFEIAFNAGTHAELIKLTYHDFARLVNPQVVNFTT
jgi:Ala-tRNA(Pro) deacylase